MTAPVTAELTEAELRDAIETMPADELRALLALVYSQSGGIH